MAYEKIAYNNEFNKQNYDDIKIRVQKGTRTEWKNVAAKCGQSLNAFIIEAVEARISKENS